MKKFPVLFFALAAVLCMSLSASILHVTAPQQTRVERADAVADATALIRAKLAEASVLAQDPRGNAEALVIILDEVDLLLRRVRVVGLRGGTLPKDPPPDSGTAWPDDVPFDAPAVPEYTIPTLGDCDWTVAGGKYTSQRGLETVYTVHDAYRASVYAGHDMPVRFGVWDSMGYVVGAGIYNADAAQSVTAKGPGGKWSDVSFEIVGLDDSCDVTLSWTKDFGSVAHLGVFNIGLRGPPDSFYVRANDGIGTAIFDGCWFAGGTEPQYTSGIHMDKWETLVLRNWRFKGFLLSEHLFYLKSCVGTGPSAGTWIVDNDLRGGNRTGFQIRPEALINPTPRGPVVIAYNVAEDYGWTHGTDGASKGGGSCLTVWTNPYDSTYIFGNKITNARYGCLVLSGQGDSENYLNEYGYPIYDLYMYGNTFENKAGDRTCITISATGEVHLFPGNTMAGPLNGDAVFNDTFNMNWNGIENGTVTLHGKGLADYYKGLNVRTYDPLKPGTNKPMLDSVIDSWPVQ